MPTWNKVVILSVTVLIVLLLVARAHGSQAEGWRAPSRPIFFANRILISSEGNKRGGRSWNPALSVDGRYEAFASGTSNLMLGGNYDFEDLFVAAGLEPQIFLPNVLGTPFGTTSLVSVSSEGIQGKGSSFAPSISGDGRYVAFYSHSSNLVEGDTNGAEDVFVHDRETGETSRVSVTSDGTEGDHSSYFPAISADGRYVAFESVAFNLVGEPPSIFMEWKIILHDREMVETVHVSVTSDGTKGEGDSRFPAISADGRYVAFESVASNLVAGDTNDEWDVFVHDLETGKTERVSVDSGGAEGNSASWAASISADGRYVAFESVASNLVAGDTNDEWDVFVHDLETGKTERVSVDSGGAEGNSASWAASISADGRYVAFESWVRNFVPGDNNHIGIFVHDRETGETIWASAAPDGSPGNWDAVDPAISADGRYVTFYSFANNLVSGDTNEEWDVFVFDRETGKTTRVSVSSDGVQGNGYSNVPSISADGGTIAFASFATNLVPGGTSGGRHIFVHER